MKTHRWFLGNALLVLVSLLALFLVLEVAARIVLFHSGDVHRFLRYASLRQVRKRSDIVAPYLRYSPHRYLGYYPTPDYAHGHNKHNSTGYRDDEIVVPKPQGEFRIVCLGGSTTYTCCVGHYGYSYPNCLERELHERGYTNVNVINAGGDGWSSYETLINFAFRVQDLDPDVIFIRDGLNDVFARIVWPPEAYKGDNSGYRAPLVSQVFMPGILEYSTLIRGLMLKLGMIQPHTALMRSYDTHHGETFHAFEYEEQLANGTYPEGVFEEAGVAEMLAANAPVFFRRNVENTITMAQRKDIRVVLVTLSYSPHQDVRPGVRPLMSSPEFLDELEECNKTIASIAKDTGVPLFDIAAVFPSDHQYFQDGIHVNFEGVQLEGKLFADFLIENDLIPRAPL